MTKTEALKLALAFITKGSKILTSTTWQIHKGKKQAKRASKIFQEKLIKMGVSPEAAKEFAEQYRKIADSVSVKKLLRDL